MVLGEKIDWGIITGTNVRKGGGSVKITGIPLGGNSVGDGDYNMVLSERRAASARSYLLSNYEVDPDNIHPAGYGEAEPLIPGTSEEARRRNRRVVIEQMP